MNVDDSEDLMGTHITREKENLILVSVGLQDRSVLGSFGKGPSPKLISKRDYEALPKPTTLRPPGTMIVVAGHNQEIPLLGWINLRFTISTRGAYHDFRVGKNLPIDRLIGGEFLRPHESQIMYNASGRDASGIKDGS